MAVEGREVSKNACVGWQICCRQAECMWDDDSSDGGLYKEADVAFTSGKELTWSAYLVGSPGHFKAGESAVSWS